MTNNQRIPSKHLRIQNYITRKSDILQELQERLTTYGNLACQSIMGWACASPGVVATMPVQLAAAMAFGWPECNFPIKGFVPAGDVMTEALNFSALSDIDAMRITCMEGLTPATIRGIHFEIEVSDWMEAVTGEYGDEFALERFTLIYRSGGIDEVVINADILDGRDLADFHCLFEAVWKGVKVWSALASD